MPDQITLTLAHSPDPDDVFMWWPITGMIEPPTDPQRLEPARVVSRPVLETGRFRFVSVAADIAALNRHAASPMKSNHFDITALSMFAWAGVRERYTLTSFGSSVGSGYGPKVVTRASAAATPASNADALAALRDPGAIIAVPGVKTTAFLLLSMILGPGTFRYVEMPFDRILDAVREGSVNAGLLIHQSQLTYRDLGLSMVLDVGAWWERHTGLPLPLGGNAIRNDLDQRFGRGSTREVVDTLWASLQYALAHREESLRYGMRFAPELSEDQARTYIEMYVNDLTIDAGPAGERAIERLITEGARAGLCADAGLVRMLRPSGSSPTLAPGTPPLRGRSH